MTERAVVVASPPRRPPPPSLQKNQEVGVASPTQKQLKERKDTREDILIVDSRSKFKSKSKPEVENDTSLTGPGMLVLCWIQLHTC